MLSNALNAAHEERPKSFQHSAAMYHMATALDIDHPAVQAKLGVADVILFQRNVVAEPMYRAMDYWRALGKIVVVDLDDHYPNIPASNPAFAYWHANVLGMDPPPVERLAEGLRHADALISPSQTILDDWADVVPGYLWPNYPSAGDYSNLARKVPLVGVDLAFDYRFPTAEEVAAGAKPDLTITPVPGSEGRVYFGWGGSVSHMDGFTYSGVIGALRRLMAEDPRVYLKFGGYDDRLGFLLDQLPADRVVRQRGVDAQHWPQVVSTFDVGIAPMDTRPSDSVVGSVEGRSYDERRSWLKLVEYLCAGVPFVATDCAPYRELGRFGKLVENTEEAWYQGLKSRADGVESFWRQAQEDRQYALRKLTIDANAERLVRFYTRIGEETQARRMGAKLPNVVYVD